MVFVYRNSGPWGSGKGSPLSSTEADTNLYSLVQAINAKAAQGIGVASAALNGSNQLVFRLTDSSYLAPVTLPIVTWNFEGAWQPNTVYAVNTVVSYGQGAYLVIVAHTSASTFSVDNMDGNGHLVYDLLFEIEGSLPTGGPVGSLLMKNATADFAASWVSAAVPSGGAAGAVLTKTSSGNYAMAWAASAASVPVQTQTGADFTPALTDAGTYNRMTNASPGPTVFIPANTDVAFPVGTEISFRQASAESIIFEIASGSPVEINVPTGYLSHTSVLGATVTIKKVDSDVWDLFGLLAQHS